MSFRTLLIAGIAIALLVTGAATWLLMPTPEPYPEPGNYIVLGPGDRCALHAIKADPLRTVLLNPTCEAVQPASGLRAGFRASTKECGDLIFSEKPPGFPRYLSYVCEGCDKVTPECPLLGAGGSHAFWTMKQ